MVTDPIRTLMETAPDGYFVHDVEGRFLDVNERSCRDLGYCRDDLLNMTINDISCGASRAENAILWANAPPGMSATFQQVAVRKDGSTFPVEISVTCQMIGEQKLFLGLARDITDREAARAGVEKLNKDLEVRVEQRTRELSEARELLRAVMDSVHDAILFQDCGGRYRVVNRSAEGLIGLAEAEALGKTAMEIFEAQIAQRVREEEAQVLASGQPSTLEERLPLAGGIRTFLTTRSVHRDQNGEITGLVTVARDVTDVRLSEHQMRQEHDRFMRAARVGGLGIWDFDLIRDVLHCDEQWYRIMGRDPKYPIRSVADFRPFIHPEDVDRATEVGDTPARLAANSQDYSIVFRIVRPDGEIRWVRSIASIVTDLYGVPHRAVGFVSDITDALLAEEHLKQMRTSLQDEQKVLEDLGKEIENLGKEIESHA